ncbi:hypothetical protein PHK61_09590 [Actinomycetospora lutea]|uniref:hypothetical protein n=1 Tax=Actinomycetospora lutea TaxID=663604 RepID=UPI0023659B38|nr:hypothetical protein [Actinomycetospora lutea]MDD7938667.1 hypothetical protein [Actinomycetospora lutea]
MDESRQDEVRSVVADRRTAHDQAEDLRRRIADLAGRIAESEDTVADVYEECARLRPHAAERLLAGARRARDYAARERAFVRGEAGPPGRPDAETAGDAEPDGTG